MSTEAGKASRNMLGRIGAALDRLTFGPEKPILALQSIRVQSELLALAEVAMIEAAVKSGHDWGEIGRALGVSRQAARQAYLKRAHMAGMEPLDRWIARQNRRKGRAA